MIQKDKISIFLLPAGIDSDRLELKLFYNIKRDF